MYPVLNLTHILNILDTFSMGVTKTLTKWHIFSLVKFLCFLLQKCIYVLLELLENDKILLLIWFMLLGTLLDKNEIIMLDEI